ncbi:hypothetical protein KFU94_31670 [Chloroflexi bacterium TSY]|nr:hypothetical protein [Chloroflexi bacterium TSY]
MANIGSDWALWPTWVDPDLLSEWVTQLFQSILACADCGTKYRKHEFADPIL